MTLFLRRHMWARVALAAFGVLLIPFVLVAILFGSLWLALWEYVTDKWVGE